jgi:hypothetical protein
VDQPVGGIEVVVAVAPEPVFDAAHERILERGLLGMGLIEAGLIEIGLD